LVDVMLPVVDGFEVVRRIRRESTIPILLTARGEETVLSSFGGATTRDLWGAR
jgi:DNA-binding response OmpR family regulator